MITDLLEVVSNLKLILLIGHVRLDLWVGVIDDGQEHVDQDKEDKENEEHEEDGTQNTVGCLQLVEVKVTQDDTEQGETAQQTHFDECQVSMKAQKSSLSSL